MPLTEILTVAAVFALMYAFFSWADRKKKKEKKSATVKRLDEFEEKIS